MPLYHVEPDRLQALGTTTFEQVGVRERLDLQRLLRDQVEVVAPDVMVLCEEFGEWEDSRRRIDLLCLDKAANLVVIELKRSDDGGHMELQAIRYAAMVSAMTFGRAVEVYADYARRRGEDVEAHARILEFLGWDEPEEEAFAQDVRIVLVAADFGRELTTAVMWLNERDLDIQCVRIQPYNDRGRLLLDVQRVIPLPEAEGYQIRIREKAESERSSRRQRSGRADSYLEFWTSLLTKARARSPLHGRVSPQPQNWVSASRGGVGFNYVIGKRRQGRVELYIGSDDREKNKRLFDALQGSHEAIELSFGRPLHWERLDNRIASRISFVVGTVDVNEADSWTEPQERLVDAMERLAAALKPHLDGLGEEVARASSQVSDVQVPDETPE